MRKRSDQRPESSGRASMPGPPISARRVRAAIARRAAGEAIALPSVPAARVPTRQRIQ